MESELFFLIDDYLEGIAREAWVPSPGNTAPGAITSPSAGNAPACEQPYQ